jgi:malate dehydrogenase
MWVPARRGDPVKVTVVGAGMVGSTTALRLLEDGVADRLVLVDVLEGLAQAVALDLAQAAPLRGHGIEVVGGSGYGPTEGSELVVITAGLPRTPGQSRADLLETNAAIVTAVVEEIRRRCPEAILVVVSNPLDEMTTLAWRVSGFPAARVVGMAGALDTARFRTFVAAELGTTPDRIDAIVLGSHGETMVPLPRLARVDGRPLESALPPNRVAALTDRTRDAGAEIVALLPRGSAWFAPSAAVADMARAIARDEHRVVSACAYLRGEYGISDVFLGVPVRLGRPGVEELVELPLLPAEAEALRAAAETVRARVADLAGPERSAAASELSPAPPPSATANGRRNGGRETDLVALRQASRVRRAVEQVLWERGTPPQQAEVERFTGVVMARLKGP